MARHSSAPMARLIGNQLRDDDRGPSSARESQVTLIGPSDGPCGPCRLAGPRRTGRSRPSTPTLHLVRATQLMTRASQRGARRSCPGWRTPQHDREGPSAQRVWWTAATDLDHPRHGWCGPTSRVRPSRPWHCVRLCLGRSSAAAGGCTRSRSGRFTHQGAAPVEPTRAIANCSSNGRARPAGERGLSRQPCHAINRHHDR